MAYHGDFGTPGHRICYWDVWTEERKQAMAKQIEAAEAAGDKAQLEELKETLASIAVATTAAFCRSCGLGQRRLRARDCGRPNAASRTRDRALLPYRRRSSKPVRRAAAPRRYRLRRHR